MACRTMILVLALMALAFASLPAAEPMPTSSSASVKTAFQNPPRQYATAPLWTWNDMLTEEQVRGTLRDLAGQKVKQAFIHPRPGLMTPYLSDEWFRLWRAALDEAENLDMNIWIYDENSYPSGFAGGWVPEAMPDSRGRGLHFAEVKTLGTPTDDFFAAYRITETGYENVTRKARSGEPLPEGRYLVATWRFAPARGWFGGKWYVDLLKPGVTEKFIEITLEAYKRHIGDQFGKRCPGIFTDEPHLCPAGGLHWNEHLSDEFRKRWGYNLEDHLPALQAPVGDWKKIRHNYYQLLLEQFIEHWAKPCHDWCEANGLEFTGHYWEHGWPSASHVPDNMAMYAWHQRPAIDTLMNNYSEKVNAQFGNIRSVKELASVANQLGRARTLCEAYGAGGWDLRFEDMKRIGDWLYVLGVNTLDEHLSYVTIRGSRKRDHPQSFSYHTPWWEDYHLMAGYFARLSAALSAGKQINHILVLEPTTTAWMYQPDKAQLGELGDRFQKLVIHLEKAQVEFDLGCEDIIGRHGRVADEPQHDGGPGTALFVVGQRRYRVVVLPPHTENLNSRTAGLLADFARRGGRVLCCRQPPSLVDGKPSDAVANAAHGPGWQQTSADELPELLANIGTLGPIFQHRGGMLLHHRRQWEDGQILFLTNTSLEESTTGLVTCAAAAVEQWCPHTGKTMPYPAQRSANGINIDFRLPPGGSLLLFLANEPSTAPPAAAAQSAPTARPNSTAPHATISPAGPIEIRRLGPNVLTIDYVDLSAGGKTEKGIHFYQANQLAFLANGLEQNPWDSAVQFRDEFIKKSFPAESGFEATYRFTIEGEPPSDLAIVIERPDLYTISCNGKLLKAKPGDWWLDKSFGKISLTGAAQTGENAVTIKAQPFTIYHELEPAYVLGDFSLKPAKSGFVIVRPEPLSIMVVTEAHSTDPEGTMWLSSGVGYRKQLPSKSPDDRDPELVFDLGALRNLAAIKVWNYNEVNLTERGVKRLRVLISATEDDASFREIGTFELDQAQSGSPGPSTAPRFPQTLEAKAQAVRFVKFDIVSNHRGTTFPMAKGEKPVEDNAFVGLSEVKFLTEGDDGRIVPIEGVRIARVSSELAAGMGHDRRAAYLLDSSGMRQTGWNAQGHPFYGGAVAYTGRFDVGSKPAGNYSVRLPSWYGSVARVVVNGRPAGRIAWQPWECNVTEFLQPGANTITVEVVGTLKNTLGPHHAGAVHGSAWPHLFRQGPRLGPPPGHKYDTIGYGLFEMFIMIRQ